MDKELAEKLILGALQKGDVTAFKQIFDMYYVRLVRYAISLINKPEISEEIVQDIFERLWQRRENLKIESALSTYLYTSVRYRCINYIKSKIQFFTYENDLSKLDQTDEMTPHDELELKDLEQAIKTSIDLLPEQCRIIFNLSRYSGLSNPEIAEKLGISPKTVENQMTIALLKIRSFLHKHWYSIIFIFFWGYLIFHLTN